MQGAWVPTRLAVGAVSAVSLIGAIAGMRLFRKHSVIIALVALAAGSLLGDAMLHLLPEAAQLRGGFDARLGGMVLVGFAVFFLLEVVLRHGHDHGGFMHVGHDHPGHRHADASGDGEAHGHRHLHPETAHQVADVAPRPATASSNATPGTRPRIATFAWMNLVGDGLHNFLDGIVIAAAFVVDPLVGLATTVAVALHEIPQELGDFAVLLRAGMRPGLK